MARQDNTLKNTIKNNVFNPRTGITTGEQAAAAVEEISTNLAEAIKAEIARETQDLLLQLDEAGVVSVEINAGGSVGSIGPAGAQGIQGPPGPAGANGADGVDGVDGTGGIPGGSINQIQYNDGANTLTANTKLWFDDTGSRLQLSGALISAGLSITAASSSITGSFVVSKQLQGGGAGTTGAGFPGFAFDGDHDTGIWTPEADRLILVAGGVTQLDINNGGTRQIGAFGPGTVANPAFTNASDVDTGMYFPSVAGNQVALSAGGTKRLEANTTQVEITGTLDVSGAIRQVVNNLTSSISGALIIDGPILGRNPINTDAAFGFSSSRGTGLRNNGDTLLLRANGITVATLEGASPSITVPYIVSTIRIQASSNTMTLLGSQDGTSNPSTTEQAGAVLNLTTGVTQSFKTNIATFGPSIPCTTKFHAQDHKYTISQSAGATGNYVILNLSASELSYQGGSNSSYFIDAKVNDSRKFSIDRTGNTFISGTTYSSGGLCVGVYVATGSYTLTNADYLVCVSGTLAGPTLTMSMPTNLEQGRVYKFKEITGLAYTWVITSSANHYFIDNAGATKVNFSNFDSVEYTFIKPNIWALTSQQ